ncbi:DUF2268 domain-containing putative Zn-dependent protease [Rhodophyticola porphyridii]|uniref:DUF2268 domain-containing putative Zn-dependent protease n=1 Tax=Rhodophyticola porphyridii TaxID=1852017 RepID=UPI0035D10161
MCYFHTMNSWRIHVCNARARLTPFCDLITEAFQLAEAKCRAVHEPVSIDIVVRASDRTMPNALKISGSSYGPGRVDLLIDPDISLDDLEFHKAVLRTVFHEFHHVLRWDGPGYGRTLGEALASEGLAQFFVHEMMDCQPEPWENALEESQLADFRKVARLEFEDKEYNHPDWFFGAGSFPTWAGYSVGYSMVEDALKDLGTTALESAKQPAFGFKKYL